MTTTTDINHPDGEKAPDPALDARAAASLSALFTARRSLAADLEEAGRAHTHLEQERQREADALQAQSTAEQHAAGVTARVDLAGQRFAGFTTGAVVVTVLLVFDAIPLNWAAQAFGLDAAATWLVTGIMLAASAAAMAGLELTREDSRRRRTLLVLMATGFAALAALRTMFLVTVAGGRWLRRSCEDRPLTLARALAAARPRSAVWRAAAGRRGARPKRRCSGTGPCCSGRCASGRSCRRPRPGRARPSGSPPWSARCARSSRSNE